MVVLRPERIDPSGYREPVFENLLWELSHPRPGGMLIVQQLLVLFIVQGLRSELSAGVWRAGGWLGALTDPVLRSALTEAPSASLPRSVEGLATEVHRSSRRLRARVKAHSGDGPGRLLRDLRIQLAVQRLEAGASGLHEIARESGYANVS